MNRAAFLGRLQQVAFHLRQASARLEEVKLPENLTSVEVTELIGICNSLLGLSMDFSRIERIVGEECRKDRCREAGEGEKDSEVAIH